MNESTNPARNPWTHDGRTPGGRPHGTANQPGANQHGANQHSANQHGAHEPLRAVDPHHEKIGDQELDDAYSAASFYQSEQVYFVDTTTDLGAPTASGGAETSQSNTARFDSPQTNLTQSDLPSAGMRLSPIPNSVDSESPNSRRLDEAHSQDAANSGSATPAPQIDQIVPPPIAEIRLDENSAPTSITTGDSVRMAAAIREIAAQNRRIAAQLVATQRIANELIDANDAAVLAETAARQSQVIAEQPAKRSTPSRADSLAEIATRVARDEQPTRPAATAKEAAADVEVERSAQQAQPTAPFDPSLLNSFTFQTDTESIQFPPQASTTQASTTQASTAGTEPRPAAQNVAQPLDSNASKKRRKPMIERVENSQENIEASADAGTKSEAPAIGRQAPKATRKTIAKPAIPFTKRQMRLDNRTEQAAPSPHLDIEMLGQAESQSIIIEPLDESSANSIIDFTKPESQPPIILTPPSAKSSEPASETEATPVSSPASLKEDVTAAPATKTSSNPNSAPATAQHANTSAAGTGTSSTSTSSTSTSHSSRSNPGNREVGKSEHGKSPTDVVEQPAQPNPEPQKEEPLRAAWEVDCFRWPEVTHRLLREETASFDTVLESLQIGRRDDRRGVLITGTEMGEGRSTLAVCLARRARSQGLKTLLVDGDTLGADIDRLAGLDFEMGWRCPDAVTSVEESMVRCLMTNLVLMPQGTASGDPIISAAEYARFWQQLESIASSFDAIIVDAGVVSTLIQHIPAQNELFQTALLVQGSHGVHGRALVEAYQLLKHSGISSVAIAETGGRRLAG